MMSGIARGWWLLLPKVLLFPALLGSRLSLKLLRSMESAPQTPKGSMFLSLSGARSAAVLCGWGGGIMSIWRLGTVVFANDGPGRRSGQRFKVSMACVNAVYAREREGEKKQHFKLK